MLNLECFVDRISMQITIKCVELCHYWNLPHLMNSLLQLYYHFYNSCSWYDVMKYKQTLGYTYCYVYGTRLHTLWGTVLEGFGERYCIPRNAYLRLDDKIASCSQKLPLKHKAICLKFNATRTYSICHEATLYTVVNLHMPSWDFPNTQKC
jgi:hypothetical protein